MTRSGTGKRTLPPCKAWTSISYTERGALRLTLDVCIFQNHRDMVKVLTQLDDRMGAVSSNVELKPNQCWAYTVFFTEPFFTPPPVDGHAMLFFSADKFGAGIVAHELFHVVWFWFYKRIPQAVRLSKRSKRSLALNEAMAGALEGMTKALWSWFLDPKRKPPETPRPPRLDMLLERDCYGKTKTHHA